MFIEHEFLPDAGTMDPHNEIYKYFQRTGYINVVKEYGERRSEGQNIELKTPS